MKVKRRTIVTDMDEYTCALTEELDKHLIGLGRFYSTYLLDTRDEEPTHLLAIRVLGRTIGDLELSDDMIIRRATIGSDCVSMFTVDPNEALKQFIGQELEITEEGGQEDVN